VNNQVARARDAEHDGAEDDRSDDHLDQLDEAIASGFMAAPVAGAKAPNIAPQTIATSTWKYSDR